MMFFFKRYLSCAVLAVFLLSAPSGFAGADAPDDEAERMLMMLPPDEEGWTDIDSALENAGDENTAPPADSAAPPPVPAGSNGAGDKAPQKP